MGQSIQITAGGVVLAAELDDSSTAEAVAAALPIRAAGNRWGDEFYFSIPINEQASADARAEMEVGELAYWPPGSAFCIFFGPTPASTGDAPQAASPVNPIGRIIDNVESLIERHKPVDGIEKWLKKEAKKRSEKSKKKSIKNSKKSKGSSKRFKKNKK